MKPKKKVGTKKHRQKQSQTIIKKKTTTGTGRLLANAKDQGKD